MNYLPLSQICIFLLFSTYFLLFLLYKPSIRPFKFGMWVYMGKASDHIVLWPHPSTGRPMAGQIWGISLITLKRFNLDLSNSV